MSTGVAAINKRRTYTQEEKMKVIEAYTDHCCRNVKLVRPWLIQQYGDSWRRLPVRTLKGWIDDFNARKKRAAERREREERGEEVQQSPPSKKRGPKLWIDDEEDDAYLEQLVRMVSY